MSADTFYSVLRWSPNPSRDEARNVAVLLVGDGSTGGFQHAPVHMISKTLQEQGILDAALEGLRKRFTEDHKMTVGQLNEIRAMSRGSLYFTEPQHAVGDPAIVVNALYKSLVAPRTGGSSSTPTKGKVLGDVVKTMRRAGRSVALGSYLNDHLFDAVIDDGPVLGVLSFINPVKSQRSWESVEKDAGHFLYGVSRVERTGIAVLAEPTPSSPRLAHESFERVSRWLASDGVERTTPEHVVEIVASALG